MTVYRKRMNADASSVHHGSQHDSVGDDGFADRDVVGDCDSGISVPYSCACSLDVLPRSSSCAVPAGDLDCTVHMHCGLTLVTQESARVKGCHWYSPLSHY